MATLTKAAQRKVSTKKKDTTPSGKYIGKESNKGRLPPGYKGPEKGKYYGPDKLKGANPKYKAKAPAAPAAPEAQADTTLPTQDYTAPNPANTAANASGGIELQTNYDFNMQADQANADWAQAQVAASLERQNALLQKETDTTKLNEDTKVAAGRNAGNLAARGMSGDVAVAKQGELGKQVTTNLSNIDANARLSEAGTAAREEAARTNYNATLGTIATGRQDFTNAQSRTNPTEGSLAEDSGVAPTTIPAPAAPPAAAAAAARKWKGQYRGPDKFKGDPKKLAAWRKAGRPKVK